MQLDRVVPFLTRWLESDAIKTKTLDLDQFVLEAVFICRGQQARHWRDAQKTRVENIENRQEGKALWTRPVQNVSFWHIFYTGERRKGRTELKMGPVQVLLNCWMPGAVEMVLQRTRGTLDSTDLSLKL